MTCKLADKLSSVDEISYHGTSLILHVNTHETVMGRNDGTPRRP